MMGLGTFCYTCNALLKYNPQLYNVLNQDLLLGDFYYFLMVV